MIKISVGGDAIADAVADGPMECEETSFVQMKSAMRSGVDRMQDEVIERTEPAGGMDTGHQDTPVLRRIFEKAAADSLLERARKKIEGDPKAAADSLLERARK